MEEAAKRCALWHYQRNWAWFPLKFLSFKRNAAEPLA